VLILEPSFERQERFARRIPEEHPSGHTEYSHNVYYVKLDLWRHQLMINLAFGFRTHKDIRPD